MRAQSAADNGKLLKMFVVVVYDVHVGSKFSCHFFVVRQCQVIQPRHLSRTRILSGKHPNRLRTAANVSCDRDDNCTLSPPHYNLITITSSVSQQRLDISNCQSICSRQTTSQTAARKESSSNV